MRCYSLAYLLWMDLTVRKLQWLAALLERVPGAIGASPEASRTDIFSREGPGGAIPPPRSQEQGRWEAARDSPRPKHWVSPWGWGQAKARQGWWVGSGSGPTKEPEVWHSTSMATQGHGGRDGPKLDLVQRAPWPSQAGLCGTRD